MNLTSCASRPLRLGMIGALVTALAPGWAAEGDLPVPVGAPPSAVVSAAPAAAASAPQDTRWHYVLGAAVIRQPDYPGAADSSSKIRPFWALQHGRFRLATSRASSVFGFGADTQGPGASADVLDRGRFKLSAGLRFDSGRKSADSPDLRGLPDIKPALRARVAAGYTLDEHWRLGANVSQDLLGRGGGAILGFDAVRAQRFGRASEWSVGVGATAANGRHMSSYFGITPEQSRITGVPVFDARAGMRDVHIGLGVTTALTPQWILFGQLGASRLLAHAAASPLSHRDTALNASVGLAYRCCRW